ncbi:leucyl aminopeptidase [Bdellovibrio sp. qaytius]|nr:leucyl aminopeptidase [Bdellovibrio sp. qaytius]
MQVHLHAKDISTLQGQTVVFFAKTNAQKDKPAQITEKDVNEIFEASLDDKLITGTANEAVSFREANLNNFRHVIVVGLGADAKMTHETVRQAAAALYKEIKSLKATEAFVQIDGLASSKKDLAEYTQAFVEGLNLAGYSFDELKSKPKDKKDETINVHLVSKAGKEKGIIAAFNEGTILASCTNFARRLGDMPGNLMTPTILANEAIRGAKGTGLKVTAWDKKRIEKERMGGLLGVAQGSDQEPRFIVMEYNGAAKTKKPVCFVGKGLTFDCGGVSIKPGAKMEDMKYDMMGGAGVIGTMLAIAQLKLKVNVVAYVASTENMVNGSATKPGDVHTARNGKTFEVNNTDAEGRLILADALSYASEQEPAAIIDAATLTGAMVVALGNIHTGYFTKNSPLKTKIEKAATVSGEAVWHMPFNEHHTKDMKGTYADLSNISYSGGAGSGTATAFLEQFVTEGIPWAHFDIAGTGWACGNRLNYCTAKGATGVMVRTFVEIAKQY